jgi:hypothetical protein
MQDAINVEIGGELRGGVQILTNEKMKDRRLTR